MTKTNEPSELPIDERVGQLINLLNRLPGCSTGSSCGGHKNPQAGQVGEHEFQVTLYLEPNGRGWRALALLAWASGKPGRGEVNLTA